MDWPLMFALLEGLASRSARQKAQLRLEAAATPWLSCETASVDGHRAQIHFAYGTK